MSCDPIHPDSRDSATPPGAGSQPINELLVAYLDGELNSGDTRRVEGLLSSDSQARSALQQLDRTWHLLDKLEAAEVDEGFTRTTLEMVAVAAAEDVREYQTQIPRRRLRKMALGLLLLLAFGLAGFLAVVAFRPDPSRALLENLPLLENVDEYHQIEDAEFLRRLHQEGLFDGKEGGDDA